MTFEFCGRKSKILVPLLPLSPDANTIIHPLNHDMKESSYALYEIPSAKLHTEGLHLPPFPYLPPPMDNPA
ncbi:UNVERIFIED_CONTAM: hypothetical protein Sangu_2524100 [Sesamum angustifolium]|uniref:Uncharacterized protein n=1 Tax=Sesamum angustifolium TaxID=2727405 RepID=A0AAW2JGF6_9LAMI